MLNKKTIQNKGITLIALVLTIIILIILAGITLNIVLDQDGIINKTQEARLKIDNADVVEAINLKFSEYKIEIAEKMGTESFMKYLEKKGIIADNGTINTQTLLSKTMSTGNGDGTKDVYKIEKVNNTSLTELNIVYYNEEETPNILQTISASILLYPVSSPENIFLYTETDEGITINDVLYTKDGMRYYSVLQGITDVVIPKYIKGKPVVAIESWAFYNLNIKSVTIPNTVIMMSPSSFAFMYDLEFEIRFPEGKNPELIIPENKWGANNATITGIDGIELNIGD